MSGLDEGSTDFRMRLQDFVRDFSSISIVSGSFRGGSGWPISKRSPLARNLFERLHNEIHYARQQLTACLVKYFKWLLE